MPRHLDHAISAVEGVVWQGTADVRTERLAGISDFRSVSVKVAAAGQLRQTVVLNRGPCALVMFLIQLDLRAERTRLEVQGIHFAVPAGRIHLGNDRGCQNGDDPENHQHFDQRETNVPPLYESHGNCVPFAAHERTRFEFPFRGKVFGDWIGRRQAAIDNRPWHILRLLNKLQALRIPRTQKEMRQVCREAKSGESSPQTRADSAACVIIAGEDTIRNERQP